MAILAAAEVGVRNCSFGGALGIVARLRRGLAETPVRRSGLVAAAQGSAWQSKMRRGALGLRGGGASGMRDAGGCGRFKGGRPEISAWEQGRESRRGSRAGMAAGRCAAGRGGEDGPDQAGPGCSERRGALARWRVGLGATRGEGRRGERAGLRRQVGPERARRGSRPGAGCWRGRAGPRLGRPG